MKDPRFIELMVIKGEEAREKVKKEFHGLSSEQLNKKPAPDAWSIGQCLDHLVTSDCLYFPVLKKIASGHYQMSFWEKWNPLSTFFGNMLAQQLQENVKKKVKAPKIFAPSPGIIDTGIVERFHKHLDTLLEYINACRSTDLDKTFITSPVSGIVTYNLRNAIKILIQHEHRHINQAIRIKKMIPA